MSDRHVVMNTFIVLGIAAAVFITLIVSGFNHMEKNAQRETRIKVEKVEACQHASDVSACVNSID